MTDFISNTLLSQTSSQFCRENSICTSVSARVHIARRSSVKSITRCFCYCFARCGGCLLDHVGWCARVWIGARRAKTAVLSTHASKVVIATREWGSCIAVAIWAVQFHTPVCQPPVRSQNLLNKPKSRSSFREDSWSLSGVVLCWAPSVRTSNFQWRERIALFEKLLISGIHA